MFESCNFSLHSSNLLFTVLNRLMQWLDLTMVLLQFLWLYQQILLRLFKHVLLIFQHLVTLSQLRFNLIVLFLLLINFRIKLILLLHQDIHLLLILLHFDLQLLNLTLRPLLQLIITRFPFSHTRLMVLLICSKRGNLLTILADQTLSLHLLLVLSDDRLFKFQNFIRFSFDLHRVLFRQAFLFFIDSLLFFF